MAQIVCMDCGKEVPERVRKCPHCGALIACATAYWTSSSTRGSKMGGVLRVARFILIVVALGAAYWAWQATTSDKKAPFSAGLKGAFREPTNVVDERVPMSAGQNVSYAFGVETDARVHVSVISAGCPVDVMLMPKAEAARFARSGGSLFGGGYDFRPNLSLAQVGLMDKTEVVPKGEWSLVVMRPEDAAAGRAKASVSIALTVY